MSSSAGSAAPVSASVPAAPASASASTSALAPTLPTLAAPAPSSSQRTIDVMALAAMIALQPCPLSCRIPGLWAILTAVSSNAHRRHQISPHLALHSPRYFLFPQGSHIMLQNVEHVLGRTVRESSFQINSRNVSARHCTISRRFLGADGRIMPPNYIPNAAANRLVACIRDSSSHGTYINFDRLQRNGEEMQLRHGDVISLAGTPNNETAFSFVYREVSHHILQPAPPAFIAPGDGSGQPNKRKDSPPDDVGDTVGGDMERIKGLGNGGCFGPIMLNDVRKLQRSNEELRIVVEAHMLEIEKMRAEYHSTKAHHASVKLKDVRESLAGKFSAQQEELKLSLSSKELDLEVSAALCLQQESTIELLQQRLASEAKSRVDAEEVIDGLKSRVEELEKFREEERLRISKERAAVVVAEKRACSLKSLFQEEKVLSLSAHKRADDFEVKLRQTCRELEDEKMAREGAQNKIVVLELEIETASRDLKLEKQRLQGAQELIVLRETQLRALHSTATEIAEVHHWQLSTMIRTLEDSDNNSDHTNTSPSSEAHLGPPHYSEHRSSKQVQERRMTSHSTTCGSRPMQVDMDGTMGSKRAVVQDDEKSKGTGIDDDTEGDTQQGDCSDESHSATRSSDVNIPPTQIATQMGSCGGPASTYGKAEVLQFTGRDIGATQLENGEGDFTEMAIVETETAYTQHNHDANLEGL